MLQLEPGQQAIAQCTTKQQQRRALPRRPKIKMLHNQPKPYPVPSLLGLINSSYPDYFRNPDQP